MDDIERYYRSLEELQQLYFDRDLLETRMILGPDPLEAEMLEMRLLLNQALLDHLDFLYPEKKK